jgi:hypothetical protein
MLAAEQYGLIYLRPFDTLPYLGAWVKDFFLCEVQ